MKSPCFTKKPLVFRSKRRTSGFYLTRRRKQLSYSYTRRLLKRAYCMPFFKHSESSANPKEVMILHITQKARMKMKKKFIITALLLITTASRVNADFTLGAPVNLDSPINSTSNDGISSISSDGLKIYFASDRPGGSGHYDIWTSTRAAQGDNWLRAVNLGANVNSEYFDGSPSLPADELELYFESRRPVGGELNSDIWVSKRAAKDQPWSAPVNLGVINTTAAEATVCISPDGLQLYFASGRSGGFGAMDIYVSSRPTKNDDWSTPVNLGPIVNSSQYQWFPHISPDGRTLFFARGYPENNAELWVARRKTVSDEWNEPVRIGSSATSSSASGGPNLSPDGRSLYFYSTRDGGYGGWDIWQAPILPIVDFDGNGAVDFRDFSMLAMHWLESELSVDIGAGPLGDGIVNFADLAILADNWTKATQTVYIQWIGHASVKLWTEDAVVYVDPRIFTDSPHDADLVLVTHSHSDHFSPTHIARASNDNTLILAPADVIQSYGSGQVIAPGETVEYSGVTVTGVPAYNINTTRHPKSMNWLGFIIEIGGRRIYVAGDTDLIEEMKTLGEIDAAFLPVSGTYAMNATEAAAATTYIQPGLAIPYHWGEFIGTINDAQTFAQQAACPVIIMSRGEIISLDN